MKKFTKGKWTVDIDTTEETDHSSQLVKSGQTVVCLVSPADDVCEVSTANANLIAAAPELLEALQEFMDDYIGLIDSGGCGNWNPRQDYCVVAAKKAINKALGNE